MGRDKLIEILINASEKVARGNFNRNTDYTN